MSFLQLASIHYCGRAPFLLVTNRGTRGTGTGVADTQVSSVVGEVDNTYKAIPLNTNLASARFS